MQNERAKTAIVMVICLGVIALAAATNYPVWQYHAPNSPPVTNTSPAIQVSPATPVAVGDEVTLRVFAEDPDGDRISYSWLQTSGPVRVQIMGASWHTARVTFPQAGQYELSCYLSDPHGGLTVRTVVVEAQ